MPKSSRNRSSKRVIVAAVLAVAAVAAGFAVPRLLGDGDGVIRLREPGEPMEVAETEPEAKTPEVVPVPVPDGLDDPEEAGEPETAGDLIVSLSLRWSTVPAASAIPATVRVKNESADAVHLPAAGQARASLAVVVLDAEAREVRRVVETREDPVPRRTVLLEAGETADYPIALVAEGEEPLPAGEYTAHVEFDTDPAWERTGLPMWKAPNGGISSLPVRFTVK